MKNKIETQQIQRAMKNNNPTTMKTTMKQKNGKRTNRKTIIQQSFKNENQ